MENLLNTGHSFVVMTSESLHEILEYVFVRAKEAAVAEMDARARVAQDGDRMITRRETMLMLGKSASTLRKWAKKGYLVPIKIGGIVLYNLKDINRICGNGKDLKG